MGFLANKILGKNFFIHLKVMPTHYPQKNSTGQILIEHLKRAEITTSWKTGMLASRIQETRSPTQKSSKSTITRHLLWLLKSWCSLGVVGGLGRNRQVCEGAQKKQKAENMQQHGLYSGRYNFGDQFCISRTTFGGVPWHAVLSQAAKGQPPRGVSTRTPTGKGRRVTHF